MIELAIKKIPRGASFIAFNVLAVLLVMAFVLGPVLSHFADRSDEIVESAAQLAALRKVIVAAKSSIARSSLTFDPFLPGTEDRVVSADLQSSLKSMASTAGVNVLSIRASPPTRTQQLRMIAIEVELEGALVAIRQMLSTIENQTPFLFVTAASLRSATQGDDGLIRADLTIQGAMRARASSSALSKMSNP